MIYLLTPWRSDFIMHCNEFGIHPYNHQKITWINDWKQFMGRSIKKDDRIIWGSKSAMFEPRQFNALLMEIKMRTEKGI